MTAAAIGGWTEFPGNPWVFSNSSATTTLDATTDYVAFVCKAPATGTIDKAYVRIGTTTLNGTLSVQIQNLDANGDPDGTAYGSCAQSDVAVTGSEDNTTITFSSLACSATAGNYICIKVWASVVTSGSLNVVSNGAIGGSASIGFPYITTRTSGTGAGSHASASQGPTIEYSGGVYYQVGWIPASTTATENIDNDGAVRRLGNRLILPAPVTAVGMWAFIDNDTDTTTLKLYDTDGTTELATAALVAANRQGTASRIQWVLFGAAVDLSAGTGSPYRLVATTNNTSSTSAGIIVADNIVAAHMAMMPLGTAMYHTSHDGSSWTDTDTKRAAVGLLVSKFDDGAGGGGGGALLTHPGMNGRLV